MKSIRNEIKHIMRAAAIFAALFTMTFVSAGSANAVVTGTLGNSTVVGAPIGSQVIARPAFGSEFVRPNPFFRPAAFNPFFRPSPFFRPAAFNPFFRPNPFLGVGLDLDDEGFGFGGFGLREGIGEDD